MAEAPRFQLRAIELYERPVHAAPAVSLRRGDADASAPQAFARVRVALPTAAAAWGAAAELMAPKWFDKNLALSQRGQLRAAAQRAAAGARRLPVRRARRRPRSAISRATTTRIAARRGATGFNPLLASYGPALVDRAVLDALCRALGVSFYAAMQRQPRRHRRGASASSPASTSPRSSRGLQPADAHRGAPHRRPGRRDHRGRPAAARRRRPARDAGGSGRAPTATATSSSRSAASVDADLDAPAGDRLRARSPRRSPTSRRSTATSSTRTSQRRAELVARHPRPRRRCGGCGRRILFIEQPIARKLALDVDLRRRATWASR